MHAELSFQCTIVYSSGPYVDWGGLGPGDSVPISASMDGKVLSELSKGVPEEACSAP